MPSTNKLVIEILADNENLAKELKHAEDRLHKFEQSVKNMDGLDLGNAFLGVNSAKRVKQELSRLTTAMDRELHSQLSLVQNNERAKGEIIRRFAKQRIDLEEAANTKIKQLNTLMGESGGIRSQLQQIMSQAGLGGMGDLLGGIGAKVGLIGAAFTGVLTGVRSFVNYLRESVEYVNKIETGTALTQSLFLGTEGQLSSRETAVNLEQQARATALRGIDVTEVQSAQYLAISSGIATGENAGEIMDKVAQAAIALNASLDSTTLAAGGLANALGEDLSVDATALEENLNLLNAVMDYGTIPSAEILANNISRAAPAFLQASESSDEAKQALGAMMSTITNAGVATEVANTNMMAFLTELADPAKLTKLKQLGIEGFDPLTRKITDYGLLLSSMAEKRMAVSDIFSSQEAIRGLNILTQNASQDFQEMLANMEATNIEGLYQKKYALMSSTQEMELARQEARFRDFQITLGKVLDPVVDLWNGAMRRILGAFESTETAIANLQTQIDNYSTSISNIEALRTETIELANSNLAAAEKQEQFNTILQKANEISPTLYNRLKQISEGEGLLESSVTALNNAFDVQVDLFEVLSDSAKYEQLQKNAEALVESSSFSMYLSGLMTVENMQALTGGIAEGWYTATMEAMGFHSQQINLTRQDLENTKEQLGLDDALTQRQSLMLANLAKLSKERAAVEEESRQGLITSIQYYEYIASYNDRLSKSIELYNQDWGNLRPLIDSVINGEKEMSDVMAIIYTQTEDIGLMRNVQNYILNSDLYIQNQIADKMAEQTEIASMTYLNALDSLNVSSDRVNFETFVNQQLEAQGISQANNADAYRSALQQRIAGEQAVLQTMLAELATAQAIVRESVRGSQEYIQAKGAIGTLTESTSEQQSVIANLQNMINNLPSAASVITGSGGRGAASTSGQRQREQNDFQKFLDQIRNSVQKSEESMLNIQVDSYTQQRRAAQNSHANLLKELKASLDARHLTYAQYNELIENAEHAHAVEMTSINTQMNQDIHKQTLEIEEQILELHRTLDRERRQKLLSDENDLGAEQLTETFAVEDENIRYQEQLKTLREQYGEDETKWLELRELVNDLHQDNLSAIVERGERDRQDIIRKYSDDIKNFVNTQATEREDARLTAFERELQQTNSQYTEMLKNARKYGIDMTGIYESYLLDIVKLYDDNLKKLNRTILGFGAGYLKQYQHPIMQQVNELSNEINSIAIAIDTMTRSASTGVDQFSGRIQSALDNMNRAKTELDQFTASSLNVLLNRNNAIMRANNELTQLQNQLDEVQENITNFQAAPEVNVQSIGGARHWRDLINEAITSNDISKLDEASRGYLNVDMQTYTDTWIRVRPLIENQINSTIRLNELQSEQTRLQTLMSEKQTELNNLRNNSNSNIQDSTGLQDAYNQAQEEYTAIINAQISAQEILKNATKTGLNMENLASITQFFGNITIFTNAFKELDGVLREFQSNADETLETANRMKDLFASFNQSSKEINQLKEAFAGAFNLGGLINEDDTRQQINEQFQQIYDIIDEFDFSGSSENITLQEILGLSEDVTAFYESMGIDTGRIATESYLNEVKYILIEKQPEIQQQIAMLFNAEELLQDSFQRTTDDIIQGMTYTLNEIHQQNIQQKGGMDAITQSYQEQIRQARIQSQLREQSLTNQEAAIERQLQQENLLPGMEEQLNKSLKEIGSQRNVNNLLIEKQISLLEKQQKQAEMEYLVSQWQSVSSTIIAVNEGINQMVRALDSGDIAGFVDGLTSTVNTLGSSIMAIAPQAGAAMQIIGSTISTAKALFSSWTRDSAEFIKEQTEAIKKFRQEIDNLANAMADFTQVMIDLGYNVNNALNTTLESNQEILDMMKESYSEEYGGTAEGWTTDDMLSWYNHYIALAQRYTNEGNEELAAFYLEKANALKGILDQQILVNESMYDIKEQQLDQYQTEIDLGYNVLGNLTAQRDVIIDTMYNNEELWNNEEYRNKLLEQGYETLKQYGALTGEILDYRIYNNLTEAEQLDIDLAIIEGKAEIAKLELEAKKNSENANEIEMQQLEIEKEALQDQYWRLRAAGASEKEILEIKIKRKENEKAILELKKKMIDAVAEEKKLELEHDKARGKYAEEMDKYYRAQMEIVRQQIKDTILLGSAGMDSLRELQDEYANLQRQSLDMNNNTLLAEIEHREKMGMYDDKEMDYLDDKITVLKDLLNQRINEGIIGKENWEIEEAIVQLEQEKNDLIKDRLGLEDHELNNLVKQHQQILRTARMSEKSLSRSDKAALAGIEQEISGRLSELGVSASDIASTMKSFDLQRKYYQHGGWVNEKEAIAEKGEYVIPARSAASIEKRFPGLLDNMKNIKNMEFPDYSQELHPILAEGMLNIMYNQAELDRLKSENNSYNIDASGDVTINTSETDAKKLLALISAQKTTNLKKALKDLLYEEGYNLGKTR